MADEDQVVTPSGEPPGGGSRRLEARCEVLQEALRDVEADNRELRRQMAVLAEACERMQGGGDGGAPVVGEIPRPQPSGVFGRLKGIARAVVRVAVGTLRRLWQAGDPGQRFVVAVHPTGRPAAGLPTISILALSTEEEEPRGLSETIKEAGGEGVELATWNAATGELAIWPHVTTEPTRCTVGSRDELVGALAGDWLMAVPHPAPRLPATLMEDLRWLVATERLRYVRVPVQPKDLRHGWGGGQELFLCAREVFDPDHVIDPARLAQSARSHPVVGKTVRLAGPRDAASPRPVAFAGEGRGRVVAVGRYDLWARARSGPAEHPVAEVPSGATTAETNDPRPAVVVVVSVPLDGGVDRLVAGLLQELGGELRFHVVTTNAENSLHLVRAELLEIAGARVHELGSVLDESTWSSAVIRIAELSSAASVLLVGWDPLLEPAALELRRRGLPLFALSVDSGVADGPAELWLASSVEGAEGLIRAGVPENRIEVAPVRVAEIGAMRPGSYGRDRAVRAELGVPDGHRLVLTVADLVPRCRPEDVVLVADRLRGEDGLYFLLAGEGPLAGPVADLADFMGLANVVVRPRARSLVDLVAAADVVLDPADTVASRPAVAAALAAGRPVVATRGGGVSELIGASVVRTTGDPEALAAALRRALQGDLPEIDPELVRATIERRAEEGAAVLRRLLVDGGGGARRR